MLRQTRQLIRAAMLGALVLLMSVYGTTVGATSSRAAEQQVDIEYLTNQYVPEDSQVLKEGIAQFEQAHPNIKVKFTEVPFPDLFSTIDINLGSNSPVMDVFSADAPLVPKYAHDGSILALDKYYTQAELSDFLDGDKIEASWDGKFYAVPQITSSQGVYFNVDLFKKAGVTLPPTDPKQRWTWDQLLDAAKKLTIKNADGTVAQWGLIIEQDTAPYQLYPLMESNGAKVISDDNSAVSGYINSPAAVQAMQFYQDLYNKYGVSPKEPIAGAFESGKAAMMLGGTWHVGGYKTQFPDLHWGVSPHPYFKTPVTPCGSFHVAVNAHSAHPDEAAAFAKFITGTDPSAKMSQVANEIPARKSVFSQLTAMFTTAPNDLFSYELSNTCVARPRTPGYQAMESILRDAFKSIETGDNVQTTLDDAAKKIDQQLAKYK